jgi:hypothetical protein
MVSGGRKIQGFVSAGIKEWVWKGWSPGLWGQSMFLSRQVRSPDSVMDCLNKQALYAINAWDMHCLIK